MYTLPNLPYGYDALAPSISESIMRLHHTKHHQTYVDKLNHELETIGQKDSSDIRSLLRSLDTLPAAHRQAIRNNAGGHYNHSLFWDVMAPHAGGEPAGELAKAFDSRYGSFQAFVDEFSDAAANVFGSGWVWLMPDMTITTSPNQDNPLMQGEAEPILGLDVWEHAYYLDYKNVRPDYIDAWWDVVNWRAVQARFRQQGE